MAKKNIDIDDIDAQIAALKEKKKKLIQEQLEAEKKETEQRRIKIGEIIENICGPIKDLDALRKFIEEKKDDIVLIENEASGSSDKEPIEFV